MLPERLTIHSDISLLSVDSLLESVNDCDWLNARWLRGATGVALCNARSDFCSHRLQWFLSLYPVGAACAQWKIGGNFVKGMDQNSPLPLFFHSNSQKGKT